MTDDEYAETMVASAKRSAELYSAMLVFAARQTEALESIASSLWRLFEVYDLRDRESRK